MCLDGRLGSKVSFLLLCGGIFACAGCGRESADQATNTALAKAGIKRAGVHPFEGRVTIDGQPPQLDKKSRLVVLLYDMGKPDQPAAVYPHVDCSSDGHFAFTTYSNGDGVPSGKYVVVIAQFRYNKKRGYEGPDQLKNLYNDPDKNYNIKEFSVDHRAPGSKNHDFDLKIAGVEPAPPGPKAITKIPEL